MSWRLPPILLTLLSSPLLCQTQQAAATPDIPPPGGFPLLGAAAVTEPLDPLGFGAARLPMVSLRGMSWTGVRFRLGSADITDPYQPGRPLASPGWLVESESKIAVRYGSDQDLQPSYTGEVAILPRSSSPSWRVQISAGGTGKPLAFSNLPPAAHRGALRQAEQYDLLSENSAAASGPLGSRADLVLSASGRWSKQKVPQAGPGADLETRILTAGARSRIGLGRSHQLDICFDETRSRLSDWGLPPGIESLLARRMNPDYFKPTWGFAGLRESNRLDASSVSWRREGSHGALSVSYGHSRAALEAVPATPPTAPAWLDLLSGVKTGPPPMYGIGARSRNELRFEWNGRAFQWRKLRHEVAFGGATGHAPIRNLLQTPLARHLITAAGAPAFLVEFNTPSESRSHIQTWAGWLHDRIEVSSRLTGSFGLLTDVSRGRTDPPSGPSSGILWRSFSPRAGFALRVSSRLTVRAGYIRLHAPLAGRMLEYGSPSSLSGTQFGWIDANGDGLWEPSETGPAVLRFGGAYSSIDPALRRPWSGEYNVAGEASLPFRIRAAVSLFHRRERMRLAAVNVGVPFSAFAPVVISDPGPDGLVGTQDDLPLTVYAQDPQTFAADRYLLTNPDGLSQLNKGLLAELRGEYTKLSFRAAFMAIKSWGPTNPGNSAFENDPGVIGSLLADPDTTIHATGRSYFDRAYSGSASVYSRLPARWGALETASSILYFDGLAFGRRLLVTELPQGPQLVAATVRGSPHGGHRTEYFLNWNLRVARKFSMPRATLRPCFDLLNVLNSGLKTRESDLTSTDFNRRFPLAIQPPRHIQFKLEVTF